MFRTLSVVSSLAAVLLCVSCGGDKPAPDQPAKANPKPIDKPVVSASAGSAKGADASQVLVPPKDARWTLFCFRFTGPDHVARANQTKGDLLANSTLRDWYIIHSEGSSSLYYGYYRTFSDEKDKKEMERAQADRRAVQSLEDQRKDRVFAQAMFVPVDAPDPTAPPEWNLANSKGYWSLQIAVFQGIADRKEAAVEAVREARKMGVEAYYYHGQSVSSVCIGAFPENAVVKQQDDSARAIDPEAPLMVLGPGADVPDWMVRNMVDPKTGKQVKVLEQRVEIADPALKKAMQDYPHYAVNNYEDQVMVEDPATGKKFMQARPSFLVKIPHGPQSMLAGDQAPVVEQPKLLNPGNTGPQGGQLKSIGK